MFKKILSFFLVVVMLFTSVGIGFVNVQAADDTMDKLAAIIKRFPTGKYWNHVGGKNSTDSVTSTPCTCHNRCDYFGNCDCNSYDGAIQCMGYAAKISYEITGVDRNDYEETYTLDVSKLRVGDIIRANGHSVCVTGVNGNTISITDCNYGGNCIIRWRTVSASDFRGIEYILHLKGNERVNTDTKWHDAYNGTTSPDPAPSPEPDPKPTPDYEVIGDGEIWQMDDEDSLNIRSSSNTGAVVVGSIPANAKFDVYEKSFDGEYLWAKVKYNGVTGYSVLNYSTYISGSVETPVIDKLSGKYTTKTGVSLKWSAVSGADVYAVSLYDKDKKLIGNTTSKKNSYVLSVSSAGQYYVVVTAASSVASSWKSVSSAMSFTVEKEDVDVTSVTLRKTGSIEVGKSGSFNAVVAPLNATDKTLVWTSSDKSVATVSADGVVTGIAPGKVTITCTSRQNSKVSASCDFTVKPTAVTMVQTKKGTTESTVGLSWNASEGATGYDLYRLDDKTGKYTILASGKGTSYTDKNLKAGTKYTYVVVPFTTVNKVKITAPLIPFTALTTPSAIKSIKQTGSDTGRVRVQWEAKENAYAYVVYKYNSSTKSYEKLGATTNTGFIDTDKPATKVYYRVVSVVKTSDGYASSKSSPTVNAITGLEKPEITKTQSNSSTVKLTWDAVDYATHYQIFRVLDGKKVLLKTVTSSSTSYTDKSLKSGVTYTYYVRAARKHSDSLNLYSSDTTVKVKTSK